MEKDANSLKSVLNVYLKLFEDVYALHSTDLEEMKLLSERIRQDYILMQSISYKISNHYECLELLSVRKKEALELSSNGIKSREQ